MKGIELELVEWLQTQQRPRADLALGLGDDMAALAVSSSMMLVSSDMLLDGVHFECERHRLDDIGRKAIACSLSDCAAMAVKPLAATVSLALPMDWQIDRIQTLFGGMFDIADRYGLLIVGGDTTRWKNPLAIDVSVTAVPFDDIDPVTRRGAFPGDTLYVTGPLGGSRLGRHLTFQPRVDEARAIAEQFDVGLHAMIDISDGVSLDVHRLCQASGTGAVLDESLLEAVVSDDARRMAAVDDRSAIDHALNDGEDFELLLAAGGGVDPGDLQLWPVGEMTVGEITAGELRLRRTDGTLETLEPKGFVH